MLLSIILKCSGHVLQESKMAESKKPFKEENTPQEIITSLLSLCLFKETTSGSNLDFILLQNTCTELYLCDIVTLLLHIYWTNCTNEDKLSSINTFLLFISEFDFSQLKTKKL